MSELEKHLKEIVIPGTSDKSWEPSITQLLEWYEKAAAVFTAAAAAAPAFDRDAAGAEDPDDIEGRPHYLPPWTPRPDLLREFYEAVYRPTVDSDTERKSWWHRSVHAAGGRHDAKGNWY